MALPKNPTIGQHYTDEYGVVWIYYGYWASVGGDYNTANSTTSGLLDSTSKQVLDNYNEYSGGFGISINGRLLTGDIKVVSNSIGITCDGTALTFDLSELLLDGLCLEINGAQGKTGRQGLRGKPGLHGVGSGPAGDDGSDGVDNESPIQLSNIRYIDDSDIVSSGVIDITIKDGNKLVLCSGEISTPTNDSVAAYVIAKPISRNISWPDSSAISDYIEESPADEFKFDLSLVKLLSNGNSSIAPYGLSDLISGVVDWYNRKLHNIDLKFASQVRGLINERDSIARTIINGLYNELINCEMNVQPDIALKFNKCRLLPDNFTVRIPSLSGGSCCDGYSGTYVLQLIDDADYQYGSTYNIACDSGYIYLSVANNTAILTIVSSTSSVIARWESTFEDSRLYTQLDSIVWEYTSGSCTGSNLPIIRHGILAFGSGDSLTVN